MSVLMNADGRIRRDIYGGVGFGGAPHFLDRSGASELCSYVHGCRLAM
jgi:hypothetical protein